MICALDFDGTVVKHMFPKIGPPVPHAAHVIRRLHAKGWDIILWTCRRGSDAMDAAKYVENVVGVPLHGLNENQEGDDWTSDPKVFAHLYIDDRALGCPLTMDNHLTPNAFASPYVDWYAVEAYLLSLRWIDPIDLDEDTDEVQQDQRQAEDAT